MKKFVWVGFWGLLTLFSSQALAAKSCGCAALLAQTICEGELVDLKGTIVGLVAGEGLIFETNGERLSLCGLGPKWFWRQKGLVRPKLGDQIELVAYRKELKDGQPVLIAKEIRLKDGASIILRDEACYPVWQKR